MGSHSIMLDGGLGEHYSHSIISFGLLAPEAVSKFQFWSRGLILNHHEPRTRAARNGRRVQAMYGKLLEAIAACWLSKTHALLAETRLVCSLSLSFAI